MKIKRFLSESLRAQILVYSSMAILISMGLIAYINFRLAETEAQREVKTHIREAATALGDSLVMAADAEQAQAILMASHGAAAAHDVFLVNSDGLIVAASSCENNGQSAKALMSDVSAIEQVLAGEIPMAEEQMSHDGESVLAVTIPLFGNPDDLTRVTAALHYDEPYGELLTALIKRSLVNFLISECLLVVLLIAPLLVFLDRSVLAPLRSIELANQALTTGRREEATIPTDSFPPPHEIGRIMRSRHEMLSSLEASQVELSRRLRELSALNATAALLSQSLDMDELLQRTLNKVLEITVMDAGEISLIDPQQDRLRVQAQRGFPDEWLALEADRPATCLCGIVVGQAVPLCVKDINKDTRTTRSACNLVGFRGFIAIPLQAEGEALGVMSLHSYDQRAVTPQEYDLLTAIGNQVGVALHNVNLHQEVHRLAMTDALTGIANRRAFDIYLADEIRRAKRYNRPLALIMADINHFKNYNDIHGHPQGDILLREIANVIANNVRDTDFVARYGGEEFVVILPETGRAGVLAVAEKLRAAMVAYPFPLKERQPAGEVTLSLGVATYSEDPPEGRDMVQRADNALYCAKEQGRNLVVAAWNCMCDGGA